LEDKKWATIEYIHPITSVYDTIHFHNSICKSIHLYFLPFSPKKTLLNMRLFKMFNLLIQMFKKYFQNIHINISLWILKLEWHKVHEGRFDNLDWMICWHKLSKLQDEIYLSEISWEISIVKISTKLSDQKLKVASITLGEWMIIMS
jgi:hypothetical protein